MEDVMKRKLAAIVLAVAMVFTLMPMTQGNFAYADEVTFQCELTDSELTWTPPEGAVSYEIDVNGNWLYDYMDITETSVPRSAIESEIINKVISGYYEQAETYPVTISAADSYGGVIGYAHFDYPNPVDGKIKNVNFEEGYVYWDNYYPGTYKVYIEDIYVSSEYDNLYFPIDEDLEYKIESGIVKKAEDNNYTIKIEDVVNFDDGDRVVASWEGTYYYETVAENPEFELIDIDEDGYLCWDYAPYKDYVDVVIDGAVVHDVDNYFSIPENIDKMVISGKIDKAITNHEITAKAYKCNESGEGGDFLLYEWTGHYEYTSDKELLLAFPEGMAIDQWGNIQWSYFKDVDHFNYYINEYVNDYYIWEQLELKGVIDNAISNGELTKPEDGVYNFKLEAVDANGAVLDTFEGTFTYESPKVSPADKLYYLEVLSEEGYSEVIWNRVYRVDRYELYVSDVLVDAYLGGTSYSSINERIDQMIRNEDIAKATNNVYKIEVKAIKLDWNDNDEEIAEVISSKSIEYEYASSAAPILDHFDENEIILVDNKNDEEWYGWLKWNQIKGAEFYTLTIDGYTYNEHILQEYCSFYYMIDQGIRNGYFPNVENHTVTIKALRYVGEGYSETEVIDSYTGTFKYASDVVAPAKDFEKLDLTDEDGELRLEWNQIAGAYRYRYTIDGKSGYEYSTELLVDSIIDSWIRSEGFPNVEEHTIFLEALDSDGNVIATSATLNFTYKSDAKVDSDKFDDVEFVYIKKYDEWDMRFNHVIGVDHYRLTICDTITKNMSGYTSGFCISDIIDQAIRTEQIENTGSFEIKFEALDEDGNNICEPWTGIFEYDSPAEPSPTEFVVIEEYVGSEDYYLRWKPVRYAERYVIYVNGIETGWVDWESADFYEYIDRGIYNGTVEKQDTYEVEIKAFNYRDYLCSLTRTVRYNSDAVPPADHFLPEAVKVNERTGRLVWNMITGFNTSYYEDYYRITIDGYERPGYLSNNYLYLYDEIDEYVRYGYIPDTTEHTVKIEAIREHETGEGDGYEYTQLCEPWVGTFSYKAAQDVVITIENGMLNAKYKDGSEIQGLDYGWIKANDDDDAEQYFDELPFNVNEAIDSMIEGNEDFEKTGVYDLYLYAYNTNGRCFIFGDYKDYAYDSQAEYIKPVVMQLTKNGKIVSWAPVEGTDEYVVEIEGARTSYGFNNEITEYDVEQLVDELISEGRLDAREDGQYTFIVTAYNEKEIKIGSGSIDFEYHSQTAPAGEMEVRMSEDGTLTWDAVEGAMYYQVGVAEWYTQGTSATTANINEIIDEGVADGYVPAEGPYNITVMAYNENSILLKKWIYYGYDYKPGSGPEPVCEHVWGNETVTKEPTCEAPGSATYTCTLCGATKSEEIPPLGHDWGTHIEPATPSENGVSMQQCKVCGETKDVVTIYSPKTVSLSKTKFAYTGKAIAPKVTVKDSQGKVIDPENYTVTYPKAIGKQNVKITFKGNYYSGSLTKAVTINPAKVTGLKLTSPKSKQLKVTYTKGKGSVKYEIAYRVKGTSKWKTVKVTGTSKLIKKLKGGKTYQVRVRAYKVVSSKTYTGAWTAIKKLKVKK